MSQNQANMPQNQANISQNQEEQLKKTLEIHQMKQILVIDTEAGGLNVFKNSILSLAFVSFDGSHQAEFYVLEDQLNTEPQAMAVNGIDLDWLKSNGLSPKATCLAIDQYISELIEKTGEQKFTLVGHNIAFDIAYLKRLYEIANHPYPKAFSHRSVDTHSLLWALSILAKKEPYVCTSDGAFRHYQIEPPPALRHTALGDAVATRDLIFKILGEF